MRLSTSWPVAAAAAAVAVGGVLIAAFGPDGWFVWFRTAVVGAPDPLTEPFILTGSQRVLASAGALLGGAAIWRLSALGAAGAIPAPGRRRTVVASMALAGVVLLNLRWAGVQLGLWHFWLPWLGRLYLPAVAVFCAAALAALGIRHLRLPGRLAVILACAPGAAYGCFSALWHCCAPIWSSQSIPWPLALLALLVWAVAFAGFIGGVSAPLRSPAAEAVGAALFAVGYPWHTPLWFVQGLVGGVFSVWLTRRAGCALAPGLFLACAYATHTTLPFLV